MQLNNKLGAECHAQPAVSPFSNVWGGPGLKCRYVGGHRHCVHNPAGLNQNAAYITALR